MLIRFLRDSSGIAAIDYVFLTVLAFGVEHVAMGHGEAASLVIKRILGLG